MQEADQMIEQISAKSKQRIKKVINPTTYMRLYDNIERIHNRLKHLKKWLEGRNSNKQYSQILSEQQLKIEFTGQHTDIVNITRYEKEHMPCSEIDKLDGSLQANVREEFNIAQQSDYIKRVKVDNVDYYVLTPKGREHINSEAFLKQYEQHQTKAILKNNQCAVVRLQGSSEDLNVFRYADKIDLSQESTAVQNYFNRCSPTFVNIKNGVATPTKETRNWLINNSDSMLKNGNIKPITADNVDSIMKATTKTAAKEGAKTAAKEGAKTVAKEGAKTAAKEGAKAVAKEGAKAVAKGAGVASGAATAGVGTVVTLSVEGAKQLGQAYKNTQNQVKHMQSQMHRKQN